jgi:hypothetical protein
MSGGVTLNQGLSWRRVTPLLNRIYVRLRLSTVEFELAHLPIPGAEALAGLFRTIARAVLLVSTPIALVLLSPFLLLVLAWRMRDEDTTSIVVLDQPEPVRPTGVILLNDWEKCGSTAVFRNHIHGLKALGFNVDLIVMSDHFVRGERNRTEHTEAVLARARRVLPIGVVSRVLVFHQRAGWGRLGHRLATARRSVFYRMCTSHIYLKRSMASVACFVSGAKVVVVNRVIYMNYLPHDPPVFLETQDIVSSLQDLHNSAREHEDQAYELQLARKATVIGCFTEDDAKFYRRAGPPVVRSRFGVELPEAAEAPQRSVRLLYVGDAHFQNLRSLQETLPGLPAGAQLLMAGRIGSLLAARGVPIPPNARALGFVESLQDEVDKADVVVVPDYYGTGVSVKMIEACGWGKPLFVSRRALRGLEEIAAVFPSEAIAPDRPDHFFGALLDRVDSLKAADWNPVRKAASARSSDKVAQDWAEVAVAMIGREESS